MFSVVLSGSTPGSTVVAYALPFFYLHLSSTRLWAQTLRRPSYDFTSTTFRALHRYHHLSNCLRRQLLPTKDLHSLRRKQASKDRFFFATPSGLSCACTRRQLALTGDTLRDVHALSYRPG